MKTILAATDFSEISRNAVNYAAGLALKCKARLILFHAFHPPVILSDGAVTLISANDQKKDAANRLKRYAAQLKRKFGAGLRITVECRYGLAVDELQVLAKETKADLVIMGIKGSNTFSEKLFGSTALSFIRNTTCPVLTINREIAFRSPKKILIAVDYREYWPQLPESLVAIAKTCKSEVQLLHVSQGERAIARAARKISSVKFHEQLEGITHSFKDTIGSNISATIGEYALSGKFDLVVMTPHHHSFIESLLHALPTDKYAFHGDLPLMSIHG
jgi:nucleotide-binding universal stress UspA family protein